MNYIRYDNTYGMSMKDYMDFISKCRSKRVYTKYEEKMPMERELDKMGIYEKVFMEDMETAGAYMDTLYKDLNNEGIYYLKKVDTDTGYLFSIIKYEYVGMTIEEEIIGDRKLFSTETNPDKMNQIKEKLPKVAKFLYQNNDINAWQKDNIIIIIKEDRILGYR